MENTSKPGVRVTPLIGGTSRMSSALPAGTGALKDVVREVLDLTEEHTVVLQELQCTEPGCPPVETVIVVLSPAEPARKWTLHSPLAAVTPNQIRSVLTFGGHP